MTARRAGAVAAATVVVTSLLLVLLAAWAASTGPSDVLNGGGRSAPPTLSETSASVSPSTDEGGAARTAPPPQTHRPGWVRVVALLLDLAVAAVVLYLLVRFVGRPLLGWAVRLRWRRQRRRPAADEAFVVLEPSVAVAAEMLADAGAQREALLGDTPRNAVVACWHRFEAQGETAGLPRHPWETSSEYTMRVLDLVDAHQPAAARLGALYREARFSEHELTEAHRQEALDALDAIHRTIGALR